MTTADRRTGAGAPDQVAAAAVRCWILREDPGLAEAVDPELRAQAQDALVARELRIGPGPWNERPAQTDDSVGLLVLDGVILHRVGIGDRFGVELVGAGDLLRTPDPWPDGPLAVASEWVVLERARIAVLDGRFSRRLSAFPEVAVRLFRRTTQRSHRLAVNMAIVQQARVDVRLQLLLWHLAGRFGRVRPDGVLVSLKLTHAVLADLVAARRPTVTTALASLREQGLVHATDDGWLLSGRPPAHPAPAAVMPAPPRRRQGPHREP
ncbi:MAG: Crp/Fnr family transcriptional regulator [Solirubrobacteraceae bacterium]